MTDMALTLVETENAEFAARVAAGIREYNNAVSSHHLAARTPPDTPAPLQCYLLDGAGALQGGLVAQTYWGWLEIEKLWLAAVVRGGGWGRFLLARAEAVACERGCSRAYLETYSFQVRGFYERYGYRVVGALDDYPPGAAYYWMRKDFV